MQRCSFKIGMRLLEVSSQIGYEISRRLATGKLQLLSDTGEIFNLTDAELHRKWLANEWEIDVASLGSTTTAIYITVPRDLGTYPENQQQEAKRRKHYLEKIDPEANPYQVSRWHPLIEEAARELQDRYPPAPSTVQNWWRRYRNTKSVICLVPHNKPSTGPRAKRRYQIFEEVIATVYLNNQKLPRLKVVEEVYPGITFPSGPL